MESIKEFTYKVVNGIELKLNMYTPPDWTARDNRPAIVFFFGGGWAGGKMEQFGSQSKYFAERGMVAFTADYRVKSRHGTSPFECVEDGISAVQWIKEHSSKLGVDSARVAAAGGSAGGHVAACTAVLLKGREITKWMPNALILFNPVTDTTESGFGYDRIGERSMELSCTHHITEGLPPTLIFHGTADTTVPISCSEAFCRNMRAKGNRCELVSFEGETHGFFNFGRSGNHAYDKTMKLTDLFLVNLGFLKPLHEGLAADSKGG